MDGNSPSIYEEEPIIEQCTKDELEFLTIIASLIDYSLQIKNKSIPTWTRNSKLSFKFPYYYSKRISELEKLKILITAPGPFRRRNVYFDLNSITRR